MQRWTNSRPVDLVLACKKVVEVEVEEGWCVAILGINARSQWIYMKRQMNRVYKTIDEEENDGDV